MKKGAKFRKYVGHSSHVTNVRFTQDKRRVITIGGADHAVFQWRFMPDEDAPDVESVVGEKSEFVKKSATPTHGAPDDVPQVYQGKRD